MFGVTIKKGNLFLIIFFLVLTVSIYFFATFYFSKFQTENFCKDGTSPVRLALVGDLLIGSGAVWQQIAEDNYSPAIVKNYLPLLKESDFLFANFEGIITEQEAAREKGLPPQFSVKTDPKISAFLENFDNLVLSFANNHSADFGKSALDDTMTLLQQRSIDYIGIGQNQEDALAPYIIEKHGIRIAFIALTDLLPLEYYASPRDAGVAELTADNLKKSITQAKKSSDFIIVSLHTADAIDAPFSIWPDKHQLSFSHLSVDYGADLVIGQQPHGLQLTETYRDKLIFYSLGLFLYNPSVSWQYRPDQPLFQAIQFKGGGILNLKICKNYVDDFRLISTKMAWHEKNLIVVPSFSLAQLLSRFTYLNHTLLNIRWRLN